MAFNGDWPEILGSQQERMTAAAYEALPAEISRSIEVADGHVVFSEVPSRNHQTAARRVANLIEDAAKLAMSRGHKCLEVNMAVDLGLQDVPLLNRRPDVVLYHCLDRGSDERLRPEHILLVVEIVSAGPEATDTAEKIAEYAQAGIPHYWIARLDGTGVSVVERYRLDDTTGLYKDLDTHVKGDDAVTVEVTDPIPIDLEWPQLEF